MAIKKTTKKTIKKKKPSRLKISLKDSDSDGLPDFLEKKLGTNPRKKDTDNDGMSDGEEVRRGRNPKGEGLLKDLFIPHEGNGYLPHALKPKRLALYTGASLLIKGVIVMTAVAFPLSAILSPDILSAESKKVFTLTNQIRVGQKLPPLKENDLLDQATYKKAEDMILNQYFAHTSPAGKKLKDWLDIVGLNYLMAGENLAMGFSSAEEVVNAWTKSKTHYRNIIDPDFKEMGVSMVSGNYQNYDTTFVAQLFANLGTVETASVEKPKSEELFPEPVKPLESFPPVQKAVKSEKLTLEAPLEPEEVKSLIDLEKTKIMVINEQDQKAVRVEAFLDLSVVKAEARFGNYQIELFQEAGKWIGQRLIFDDQTEQIFNPVTLASLTVTDSSGKTETQDINWENVIPQQPSLVSQYFFVKNNQNQVTKPIFSFGLTFFQVLLGLMVVSLILNVFIEIKKQHPKTIAFSLAFIFFLSFLIIL